MTDEQPKNTTTVDVYIGDKRMQGILPADLTECDLTAAYAGAGSGTITVDRRHDAAPILVQDPAWVEVRHRGELLFTAFIEEDDLPFGDDEDPTQTHAIRDHWCILDDERALIAPDGPIVPATLSQLGQSVAVGALTPGSVENQSGYFAWQGSSAETAVRDLVSRNLAAAGYAIEWASADQGRGPALYRPEVRMTSIAEAILPVLEQAGLGIRVWRSGNTYMLDIIEPADYPQHLTLAGPLRPGRAKRSRVAFTRALVGGPGQEAARAWWLVIDEELRARFDRNITVVRDATGFTFVWPASLSEPFRVPNHYGTRPASEVPTAEKNRFLAYLDEAGRAALAGGVPTSTLTVGLAEDGDFQFGTPTGFQLGDRVRMTERMENGQPAGPVFDDRISTVHIVKSRGADEIVTPVVGGADQSEEARLYASIARLAAADSRRTTEK